MSRASELFFKARSQSLDVNEMTYKWNKRGENLCRMCISGMEESVHHIVVECEWYRNERKIYMRKVRVLAETNMFNEWDGDDEKNVCSTGNTW